MSVDCIANHKLEDTGFNYTMSLIQGKYKMFILYTLGCYNVVRFNEMKKYIGDISDKTLSSTLKELEADGVIRRKEYPPLGGAGQRVCEHEREGQREPAGVGPLHARPNVAPVQLRVKQAHEADADTGLEQEISRCAHPPQPS